MCVLGQMVRSSAQACRAAQSRPCRLAGTTGPGPRPLQARLKTPSKQVRQETRSWGAHRGQGRVSGAEPGPGGSPAGASRPLTSMSAAAT